MSAEFSAYVASKLTPQAENDPTHENVNMQTRKIEAIEKKLQ